MSRLAVLAVILEVGAFGACSGTDHVVPPRGLRPTHIQIMSGNQQAANPLDVLPQPLVIEIMTDDAIPVPGVPVDWSVNLGGGTVSSERTYSNSDGQTSVVWTLGATAGGQSVAANVGGISDPASFSATASSPSVPPAPRILVLHYDGTTVTTQYIDSTGNEQLRSVWGSSPSDVIALGPGGSGFELRYDGAKWSKTSGTSIGGPYYSQMSVSGSSASDIYAIRYAPKFPNSPPPSTVIIHYDGQSWKTAYTYTPATSWNTLYGLWERSPSDIFAVGDSGYAVHYDGTNWNVAHTDSENNLFAVWADPFSPTAFAVGMGGTIERFDGAAWHKQESGTTDMLGAVWGSSAHDVFVTTLRGGILHYDGTSWSVQNSGTTKPLSSLWGFSPTSVFAVGNNSVWLRYDGTSWTQLPVRVPINFCGVWGSSPSDVFAIGCGW